jgi:SAM-dependent methyltransferase
MSARQLRQFGIEYSGIFKDESVASAYRFRPEYPPETFAILDKLIDREISPCRVLDAACGTGHLARKLIDHAGYVDAIDFSRAMIEEGRRLPGGDSSPITWICSTVEAAPINPPYSLVVIGDAMHWLDWEKVMPRFAQSLTPHGVVAIAEILNVREPWSEEIHRIAAKYSMNRSYQPYDMRTVVDQMAKVGLFKMRGSQETSPIEHQQSIAAIVESLHARNGFSRDRMNALAAAECDDLLTRAYEKHFPGGIVGYRYYARVMWGRPV